MSGRKTDCLDCQWRQPLHSVGLLQPSFRPEEAVCAVRTFLRYREILVADGARQILHVQKALTPRNLPPHRVLTDLTGRSGTRMIAAILAGEREPEQLAALGDPQVKAPRAKIVAALFRLAAQVLPHSQSGWGQYDGRMRAKLGGPGAITALAHQLARIYDQLVTTREADDETVFQRTEQQHQEQQLQRLRQQAQALGFTLTAEACVS